MIQIKVYTIRYTMVYTQVYTMVWYQPVNYIDGKCCVQGKGKMWRFIICLECLYKEH
jgi:hypothetical protein